MSAGCRLLLLLVQMLLLVRRGSPTRLDAGVAGNLTRRATSRAAAIAARRWRWRLVAVVDL